MGVLNGKDQYGMKKPKKVEDELEEAKERRIKELMSYVEIMTDADLAMINIIYQNDLHFNVDSRKDVEEYLIGNVILSVETELRSLEDFKSKETVEYGLYAVAKQILLNAKMFASALKTGNFGKEWADRKLLFNWFVAKAKQHLDAINNTFDKYLALPKNYREDALDHLRKHFTRKNSDHIDHMSSRLHNF
jgi:hypothetical protein